jgi:hypothetical protein
MGMKTHLDEIQVLVLELVLINTCMCDLVEAIEGMLIGYINVSDSTDDKLKTQNYLNVENNE